MTRQGHPVTPSGILANMRNLVRSFVELRRTAFLGSKDYWEGRYVEGGDSGHGSYGFLAAEKARFLNAFIEKHHVASVIEFGCGDGNQLSLARYPRYLGLDVSEAAV